MITESKRDGYFYVREGAATIFDMQARRLHDGSWMYRDMFGDEKCEYVDIADEVDQLVDDADRNGLFPHVYMVLIGARTAGKLLQERTLNMNHFAMASYPSSCYFDLPVVMFPNHAFPVRVVQLPLYSGTVALADKRGYVYISR